jgi:hypothetical protein
MTAIQMTGPRASASKDSDLRVVLSVHSATKKKRGGVRERERERERELYYY